MRWLTFDDVSSEFIVYVEDVATRQTICHRFDYVVVASGRFTPPKIPTHVIGFNTFPGPIIHSYQFFPELCHDKNVLIVGSGIAAQEVALYSLNTGVKSLTVSDKSISLTNKDISQWHPDIKVDMKPRLIQIWEKKAIFADGSFIEV